MSVIVRPTNPRSQGTVPRRWRSEVDHVLISEDRIARRVRSLARTIERDFRGRDFVVVSLLNGTVMAFQDCSAACTDQQIALHDLYQVEQALLGSSEQLGGQLVGGVSAPRVCIDGPAGGSGVYTVAIAWRGLTRLSNPTIHACGTGSGAYDASGGADPDAYRRVLAISTYIGVPV